MASIKQRIESLEQEDCQAFSGYAVACTWDYYVSIVEEDMTTYTAANGLIPDTKQVVLIGWAG